MIRRSFLSNLMLSSMGFLDLSKVKASQINPSSLPQTKLTGIPFSICTWNCPEAITISGDLMVSGTNSLDAVIKGVAVEEANVDNTTVGIGATPDREGHVTLDACVMNSEGNCGAVMAVENIVHVADLARKVMLETPHVILNGIGAEQFAYEKGFAKTNLLTKEVEAKWKEWLKTSNYQTKINIENHDTIGMLCIDKNGDLSGACTTSGLGYKMRGRVGDSPIIGSGLFVDNEVGAATATGMGEEVIKTVGSFLIVELMRSGMSPQAACEEAIQRVVSKQKGKPPFQVGFIAVNTVGAVGSYSIHSGFSYTYYENGKAINKPSKSIYKTI